MSDPMGSSDKYPEMAGLLPTGTIFNKFPGHESIALRVKGLCEVPLRKPGGRIHQGLPIPGQLKALREKQAE